MKGRPAEDYSQYIGRRFGRLVVCSVSHKNKYSIVFMQTKCDCGQDFKTSLSGLKKGRTFSCGCKSREDKVNRLYKHGKTGTRLHNNWLSMKDRCNNPKNNRFESYGGKGISVCKEWADSFESFEKWALSAGFEESKSIDRIDNDKGYSPENCRWADIYTQANNKSINRYIEHNCIRMSVSQWARERGINQTTLSRRILSGWPIERALELT